MKLAFSSINLNSSMRQNRKISSVLASLFSTKTLPSSNPSPKSLYDRIQIVRDRKKSVIPVLEQWISEGGTVNQRDLQSLVRTLKNFKRFNHALQVSEWMTDRRYLVLSPRDVAIRLDLINQVHGVEHAENYFNNISSYLKTFYAYGSLLRGYVRGKYVEKAEAIMQKMREMNMATSSFPYNMLINLYSQTGEHDKIDILMKEMGVKGIYHDDFTMKNRMTAYVAASDISGMEKILNHIQKNSPFGANWEVYSIAASGYLKVGSIGKALAMLKKMERVMPLLRRKTALSFLLTLYARTGHKDALYRVWNQFKPSNEEGIDALYSCIITSLAKLDDIEGAEKIFLEWESQCTMFDFRVLNRLLIAYCNKSLLDKAESAVKKAVEGRTPYASTWEILAKGYMENKQMAKAVETLKKAMLVGRRGWRPNSMIFIACLEYLEERGDIEGLDEMIRLLKNLGPLSRDIYCRWLRIYIAAGRSVSGVLDQMEADGIIADEETQKILQTRPSYCPLDESGQNMNYIGLHK